MAASETEKALIEHKPNNAPEPTHILQIKLLQAILRRLVK